MKDAITPKWQEGTWTLTAPDGRQWTAPSPLQAVASEQRERVPAKVALERIYEAAEPAQWDAMRIDRHLIRCAIALLGNGGLIQVAGQSRAAVAHQLQVMLADSWEQPEPAQQDTRLVPVEPTPEMLDKGAMEIAMNMQRVMTAERKAQHVYRAMLAAAPQSPSVQQAEPTWSCIDPLTGKVWDDNMQRAYEEGVRAGQQAAATEPCPTFGQWQPIETAPKDESVLIAAAPDWVLEARQDLDFHGEDWVWVKPDGKPLHSKLVPLRWMPMPAFPSTTAAKEAQ